MIGIIVFVKNPELGKVKTRLAADLGEQRALDIYHSLLAYTRNVLLDLKEVERFVYFSSFIDKNEDWPKSKFIKRLQCSGGLGERMLSAIKSVLDTCKKVVIIGSDCPQLQSHHILDALDLLDSNDLVIGPSRDGGYYLLGMNVPHPELFQDIKWSTSIVFDQTIKRAESLKLQVAELEMLSDVDVAEDWEKYGFEI